MKREEYIAILKRIAGMGLDEEAGEVYDEAFISNEINRAADEYENTVKDRDRIKQQYIDDFTKPTTERAEEVEEKEPVKLEDFLNL